MFHPVPEPTLTPTTPAARAAPAWRAVLGAALVTLLDAALLAAALGGVGALLAHPRALALLAVWGAGAVVLALVRPVRSHDAVALDRESPLLLLALLLVPLAIAPVGALGERLHLAAAPAIPALEWAGVALAGAGLALRITAMATLGSRFSPVVAVQREHALETHGVYARMRHPGYLGAWLAGLGAMLAFGSWLPLPLVVLFLVLLRVRIVREERLLAARFGDAYAAYRARSGTLLPHLATPRR